MARRFGLVWQMQRSGLLFMLCVSACAPAQQRAVPPAPAEPGELPEAHFKRVDEWRFVDPETPVSPVEQQLKRQFERVFANAQFSAAYTCLAREDGNFYDKYRARPEEWLGEQMAGRCAAPTASNWSTRVYYSDGTMLDSPLSDAMLNDISTRFAAVFEPFSVFGITAQYSGPNVLVTVETASLRATIQIGEPDAERNVLVKGEVFGDFQQARAIINQGEVGSAACDAEPTVKWPEYEFKCNMAPGDEEAWVSLLAANGPNGTESPLVELPAHRVGWVPPAEYHRTPFALPRHVDTRTALVSAINELRRKLGRKPLHLATEQSNFMQTSYEQAFKLNAGGDWLGDNQMRAQMLRGDHVKGTVLWSRIASGIAFDGDAGDWLVYRMLFPVSRDTLMSDGIDEIAIAAHGDAAVGFGAAAVVYTLLTPEVEASLAERLAESLEEGRKGRPTQLLENPPELMVAAAEVARGNRSLDALSAALMRVNLVASHPYLKGFVLPLNDNESASSLILPLLAAKTLAYGIVITHFIDPNSGRARFARTRRLG